MRWLEGIAYAIDMNLANSGRCERQEAWCPTLHGIAESGMTGRLNKCIYVNPTSQFVSFFPSPTESFLSVTAEETGQIEPQGQVLYSSCLILKSTPFTTPFLPLCRLSISPL